MWHENWSAFDVWVDEGLDSVSDGIVRMKYIEHGGTSRQTEVTAQVLEASDCQKHGNRRAKSKKVSNVKVELRVLDEWKANTLQASDERHVCIGGALSQPVT